MSAPWHSSHTSLYPSVTLGIAGVLEEWPFKISVTSAACLLRSFSILLATLTVLHYLSYLRCPVWWEKFVPHCCRKEEWSFWIGRRRHIHMVDVHGKVGKKYGGSALCFLQWTAGASVMLLLCQSTWKAAPSIRERSIGSQCLWPACKRSEKNTENWSSRDNPYILERSGWTTAGGMPC